ncbi:polysaccharide pyruvyl transferase family protein [Pararobbsia silviterrae]|nr:polysaccharide pyruvyl transferase family protein [Pararobbsia silviterrae]
MKFNPFFVNHNLSLEAGDRVGVREIYDDINTNSGNCYISYAVSKLLSLKDCPDGIVNVFKANPDEIDFDAINRNHSHAFFMFQDHLGGQWNAVDWTRLRAIVERIEIPCVVFSLGVSGISRDPAVIVAGMSPDAIAFFQTLAAKSISIGVRGHITAGVLDRLGIRNYAVVGCPTFFESGPQRVVEHRPLTRDSKVAGLGLFSSDFLTNIHYVLQSELGIIRALMDDSKLSAADLSGFNHETWPNFQASFLNALDHDRVHFFLDVERWRDFFDDVALAIGVRMHGAIVALNKGCPAIVAAGDVRAYEMCTLFGIPHYTNTSLHDKTPEQLVAMANPDAMNQAYPALYAKFDAWLFDTCGLPRRTTAIQAPPFKYTNMRFFPGHIAADRVRVVGQQSRRGTFARLGQRLEQVDVKVWAVRRFAARCKASLKYRLGIGAA